MDIPIVTLTTDFGLSDHYVGTMKGVLLSRCPTARIVDISHQNAPFSILAGAYAIDQAAPFFPPGTIHVVVVDPGVGTSRKAILVESNEQRFIAPDNGVLTLVGRRQKLGLIREISNQDLFLPNTSSTFHGRDIFAAVAGALLAKRVQPAEVGPELTVIELLEQVDPFFEPPNRWRGIVFSVDHFGNVITNLGAKLLREPFRLQIGAHEVELYAETFGTAPPGECFAYLGSSGYVEIGMKQGSAAAKLNAKPGMPVELILGQ